MFGDYCDGRIPALRETGPGNWTRSEVIATGGNITSFGEGSDGRLYVLLGSSMAELLSDPVSNPAAVPAVAPWALVALPCLLLATGVLLLALRRPQLA